MQASQGQKLNCRTQYTCLSPKKARLIHSTSFLFFRFGCSIACIPIFHHHFRCETRNVCNVPLFRCSRGAYGDPATLREASPDTLQSRVELFCSLLCGSFICAVNFFVDSSVSLTTLIQVTLCLEIWHVRGKRHVPVIWHVLERDKMLSVLGSARAKNKNEPSGYH